VWSIASRDKARAPTLASKEMKEDEALATAREGDASFRLLLRRPIDDNGHGDLCTLHSFWLLGLQAIIGAYKLASGNNEHVARAQDPRTPNLRDKSWNHTWTFPALWRLRESPVKAVKLDTCRSSLQQGPLRFTITLLEFH
jgi:hypothetical protein